MLDGVWRLHRSVRGLSCRGQFDTVIIAGLEVAWTFTNDGPCLHGQVDNMHNLRPGNQTGGKISSMSSISMIQIIQGSHPSSNQTADSGFEVSSVYRQIIDLRLIHYSFLAGCPLARTPPLSPYSLNN